MIIYKAQNKINGKPYIGQTITTLKIRIKKHLSDTKCRAFHNALLKYGIENFDIDIIDTTENIDELNELEVKYIKKHKSLAPNGYNLTTGGRNRIPSEETKKKLSEANKGEKCYNYGKHLSEEHKRKIGEGNKGKFVSEKTRRKLSEINEGHIVTKETRRKLSEINKGKHPSEETKMRMSESHQGEKHWNYGKHPSEETRRKMSEAHKGEKSYWYGKHLSEETKLKMSGSHQGEKSSTAKLTEEQVIGIKHLLLQKITQVEIAKRYNVSIGCIGSIAQNKSWKYIQIPRDYILQLNTYSN